MEKPSSRLIDQRLRNRIMETLLSLAHGEKEVMEFGAGEWFESFFDHFPYEGAANQDNTAITESEWLALAPV